MENYIFTSVHRKKILFDRSDSVISYLIIFLQANKEDPDLVCSVCKSVKRSLYEIKD